MRRCGRGREPRPRLDRWGVAGAQPQSAPERLQPMLDPDELLAWGARPGAAYLGFLDLAPVVIVGRHDAAAFEQALEPPGAGAILRASRRHRCGDLVGDLIAVGAIGADGPGRPAPCPA